MPYYPPPSSGAPTGTAGGDLAGTYPNPTLNTSISTAVAFSGLGLTKIIKGVTGYTATNDAVLETAFDGDTYNATQFTAFSATSTAGDGPFVFGRFAYGTPTARTAVGPGAVLLALGGSGYNGAAFSSSRARISLTASETWSSTANGTYIDFFTTTPTTTTTAATMRLNSTGLNLATNVIQFGTPISVIDTGVSRVSAGLVGIGTGAAGAINGGLSLATVVTSGAITSTGGITVATQFDGGNNNNGIAIAGTRRLGWVSGNTFGEGNIDLQLTRAAAAALQLGAANAASPVAQTLQVQNAATANNSGAATFTHIASLSVGNGTSGDHVFSTGKNGNGSGVLATVTEALRIKGETQTVVVAAGKQLQLGNAAVTGLVAGALAALTNATISFTDSTGTVYRVPAITP